MYVSVGSCTVRVGGRTPEGTCKPGSSSSSACLLPSFGGSISGLSTSLANPLLSPQLDYSAIFHLSASDPVCPFSRPSGSRSSFSLALRTQCCPPLTYIPSPITHVSSLKPWPPPSWIIYHVKDTSDVLIPSPNFSTGH